MSVFEVLALILCLILGIGSLIGVLFFVLMIADRNKAIKEFEQRTGRKIK